MRSGNAGDLWEGKINFNGKNLKRGKIWGRWKLAGSLVSFMSQAQRRASLPTTMQREGSRELGWFYNTWRKA